MFPDYINLFWFNFSQTLLTSFLSLIVFLLFVWLYNFLRWKDKNNFFIAVMDMLVELMDDFFWTVSDKIPTSVKTYVLFLFIYILWNNLFGLFFDMFSSVNPFLEHHFRPVTTDIYFNAMLAIFWVLWSLYYGFKNNWLHFIERYIPTKWVWITPNMPKITSVKTMINFILWLIVKIIDILLWLFIGFLEFIWEFTKMLSLTLRLFWNIFAWAVLLSLVVVATIYAAKIPIIAPLVVFIMELLVWFLQAFVFSLLVLIYFKMAEESH